MTLLDFLTSDGVSGALLLVGIPACAFLLAYAAMIWRNAVRRTAPVGTVVYLLVASGGVAISLCGGLLASQLSYIAFMNASPDDAAGAILYTYAEAALLWPLGWAVLAGAALLIGGHRLGLPVRSVLAALVAGFLTSLPFLVVLIVAGVVLPGWLRVLSFLQFLAVAVVISVVAARQSGAHRLGQVTGLRK